MAPTGDIPILLLDVDGVLNAARLDLPKGWRRGTFNGFVLSWDPTVTARLRDLHESARVEIQWLNTWTTNADLLLAEPMGLSRGLVDGGVTRRGRRRRTRTAGTYGRRRRTTQVRERGGT